MEKIKRYGNTLKEQLLASTRDRIYNFMMADDRIRGVVVNGTRMVNEMRWNHELGILESLVLGHAYLAAALMGAGLKGNDRLSISVECSGPIKGFHVESNAFGEVRGYLKQVPIPIDKPPVDFNLSPFFGAGFLSVTKYLEGAKHPFTGKVMMEHGTLAKDLALYYLRSEQIPSSFSLSIAFDQQGEITGAGGLFLQALPGASEEMLKEAEQVVTNLPSIGHEVHGEGFPQAWIGRNFEGMSPRYLDSRGVEFMCHCNREQIRSMIALLEIVDIQDLSENGPFPVQIRCYNCNTRYDFDQAELKAIYSARISG